MVNLLIIIMIMIINMIMKQPAKAGLGPVINVIIILILSMINRISLLRSFVTSAKVTFQFDKYASPSRILLNVFQCD